MAVINLTNQTPSLFATVLVGCLAGLAMGACDLPPKDIGMDTKGGGTDGEVCEEGASKIADDGCNTCTCEDGSWGCTEIACGDGGTTGGDGGACMPGDTKPADDGCNTCSCDATGLWACGLLGCEEPGTSGGTDGTECEPGDSMPADDGCNTCTCDDGGMWACSAIGCPSQFPLCEPEPVSDPFEITAAAIVGDQLNVTVSYSGGCAEHDFAVCGSGLWLESAPVQTQITILHTGPVDPCDAVPSEDRSFDLLGLQQDYVAVYGPGPATLAINVTGWGSIDYSF